ncbi:2-(1,2-epoxy-1,2-dihydrophenyl)acetyl-CoA isomerase [Hydrogenophaga palleronii]|uniref:2-(1,2-epoxy-1,2-dihydrophenyl)acetyl-CoA isomerase n=1 Tax=Hydrogenophaga palleronii TaxID=65655 RepID=A0ABU1WTU3_9BURK|nr:enoyl-CoA hydratase/isomerase family protein [Hydrogenophaga palleronii]MDR7152719.1 2-(1,2-epoxy-1,2-dihydrophenyl)acetyl-CoA isomerase [Hydrogenophaga palleronii]
MSGDSALLFEVRDQVATITFNNPAKRNVFDAEVRERLADVVGQVRRDAGIRALVLTGAGGHFCSGGDLRNIAAAGLDTAGWRHRMRSLHEWLHDLITLDRPVIAAVDGAAAGAGFSLAMMADFVLATPRAKFCMSFLKVGLVPDMAAFYTLPRIVGVQRAKELMLSARDVGAEEALRLGLVMELHAPEVLLDRAQALATSFVGASPTAVSLIKRALEQAPGASLAALVDAEVNAQALAAATPEHREAVRCFLDKQALPFSWPAAAKS